MKQFSEKEAVIEIQKLLFDELCLGDRKVFESPGEIPVDSKFSALGADSLAKIETLAKAQKVFGVELLDYWKSPVDSINEVMDSLKKAGAAITA